MSRRVLITGLTALFALGVLSISLLAGRGASPDSPNSAGFDPNDIPEIDFDPNAASGAESLQGELQSITERRITTLTYDRHLQTIEQEGLHDLTHPRIETRFRDTGRVLVITADRGNVYAPNDDPRNGRFIGNVVMTMYQAPDADTEPRFGEPDDVLFHILMEETSFDLQLGNVQSPSAIALYMPDAEFHGTGLSMTFNPRRNRLEYLQIDQGESLRLHRGETEQAPEAEPAPVVVAPGENQPTPVQRADRAAQNANTNTDEPQTVEPQAMSPLQYYLAEFDEHVRIDAVDGNFWLRGNKLQLTFGVDPNEEDATALNAMGWPISRSAIAWADTSTTSVAAAQATDELGPRVTPQSPDDVVIRWDGPLTISPLNERPSTLVSVDDARVNLVGLPAMAQTLDGERVTGTSLAYARQLEVIEITGSARHPATVSARAGRMKGRFIHLNQIAGTGYVLGPLGLQALDPKTGGVDARLRCNGRMDLRFDSTRTNEASPAADAWSPAAGLGALHRVHLQDAVTMSHPDLKLWSQTLTVGFAPQADGSGSAADDILAEGQVRVKADTGKAGERIQLTSPWMRVRLETSGDAEAGLSRARLLQTQGDTHVFLVDRATTLNGQRLWVLPGKGLMVLAGQGDAAARVEQPEASLRAGTLLVWQDREAVAAIGAGQADLMNGESRMQATWQQQMGTDRTSRHARLVGSPVLVSRTDHEVSRLSADQTIDIDWLDPPTPEADPSIEQLIAVGNAELFAQRFDLQTGQQIQTRQRIRGPRMVFLSETEQLTVHGQGDMQIEDYRPEDPEAPPRQDESVAMTGRGATLFRWQETMVLDASANDMLMHEQVQMTHVPLGADGTLDETRVTLLDGTRLHADMVETGGLAMWSSDTPPSPDLQSVRVEGPVRVQQGDRRISADDLFFAGVAQEVQLSSGRPRRMAADTVLLTSRGQQEVIVSERDQPSAITAQRIEWNLETDRLRVLRPGPILVPLTTSDTP